MVCTHLAELFSDARGTPGDDVDLRGEIREVFFREHRCWRENFGQHPGHKLHDYATVLEYKESCEAGLRELDLGEDRYRYCAGSGCCSIDC